MKYSLNGRVFKVCGISMGATAYSNKTDGVDTFLLEENLIALGATVTEEQPKKCDCHCHEGHNINPLDPDWCSGCKEVHESSPKQSNEIEIPIIFTIGKVVDDNIEIDFSHSMKEWMQQVTDKLNQLKDS